MRIISGLYKGRRLCSFSADFIRPMTDRVKTSVFNSLCSFYKDWENRRALDLFSGTGNLALEALSRGAQEVYMVDFSKKAVQIIKENRRLLKAGPQNVKIYQKDVFRFLSSYKGKSFDLIFASPPFKKHYGEKILKACVSSKVKDQNTMLVLELSSKEKAPEEGADSYFLKRKKTFGDKQTLFYCFT